MNASYPGTDVWLSTAGAFAMGALAYQGNQWNTSGSAWSPAPLANASYASSLLKHAETLYKVAKETTPQTGFMDSIPSIGPAYQPSGWGDDLCTAALALAAATNNSDYYADAYAAYKKYALSGKGSVWNWDSRTPAAYVMFAELSVARPSLAAGAGLDANVTGWQAEAENYFDGIVDRKNKATYMSSAGLLFWEGDSDEASLNPAMAAAALLVRYAPLASSTDKADRYREFANGQIDYLMGKNPMNGECREKATWHWRSEVMATALKLSPRSTSTHLTLATLYRLPSTTPFTCTPRTRSHPVPYIVGMHPNSPPAPHVVRGSGVTSQEDLRVPAANAEILYGAVPGGPRPNDLYWTWRDDWVQNEIALDYNANLPALAAYQVSRSSAARPARPARPACCSISPTALNASPSSLHTP